MYKMNSFLAIFIIFIFLNFYTTNGNAKKKRAGINIFGEDKYDDEEREKFHLQKRLHKVQELGERASKRLSNLNDYTTFYTTYLKNIMRVRVPGTVGHHEVKEFIIKTLKKFGWTVELDEFNMKTPIGVKKFTNIIATLYPKAHRRLALAAHYDSKLMTPKDGKYFLAATDSAVPCAMLLDFASLLAKNKPEVKGDKIETEVTPMLLFLDGEEAFVEWTKNDSIYGSRHLAQELEKRQHHNPNLAKSVSMLEALDAFVLFDLLGTKNPTIYNFWETTSHLYKSMQSIENKLRTNGALKASRSIFVGPPRQQMMIEDDHVPFLIRGVPILHLIPVPFPVEWHTLDDNADALDSNTIEDLLKIFRQFLLGYFHLESS